MYTVTTLCVLHYCRLLTLLQEKVLLFQMLDSNKVFLKSFIQQDWVLKNRDESGFRYSLISRISRWFWVTEDNPLMLQTAWSYTDHRTFSVRWLQFWGAIYITVRRSHQIPWTIHDVFLCNLFIRKWSGTIWENTYVVMELVQNIRLIRPAHLLHLRRSGKPPYSLFCISIL